jgi:uncharacterized protein
MSRKQQRMPHDGVYARIRRSKAHGVGVFAIRDIPKGADLFSGDDSELIWKKKSALKLNKVPSGIRAMYEDFCIIEDDGGTYGCPKNFNLMTVSWFLNHNNKNPNVGCDRRYNFFALRDVKAGEELTVDYRTYNRFGNSTSGAGPNR